MAKGFGFFDLKSDKLNSSIRKSILASGRRLLRLIDRSTTCISVRDGQRLHSVEVYALAEYTQILREHIDLQKLAEIVGWLEGIVAELAGDMQ